MCGYILHVYAQSLFTTVDNNKPSDSVVDSKPSATPSPVCSAIDYSDDLVIIYG